MRRHLKLDANPTTPTLFANLRLQGEVLKVSCEEQDGFEIIPKLSLTGSRKFPKSQEAVSKKKIAQKLHLNRKKEKLAALKPSSFQAFSPFHLYEIFQGGVNWDHPGSFVNEVGEEFFCVRRLGMEPVLCMLCEAASKQELSVGWGAMQKREKPLPQG